MRDRRPDRHRADRTGDGQLILHVPPRRQRQQNGKNPFGLTLVALAVGCAVRALCGRRGAGMGISGRLAQKRQHRQHPLAPLVAVV